MPTRPGGGCRLTNFVREPEEATATSSCLELELQPGEAARLWRTPALLAYRAGRARTSRAGTIWHDTAEGALASKNMSLGHERDLWRLERLRPGQAMDWPPAHRAPLLAQAAVPQSLGWKLPDQIAPVAAFEGRVRTLALERAGVPMRLGLLEGTLRGVAHGRPACRLVLEGDLSSIASLARELGASLPITVPRAGLAAQAMAVARGQPAPPRQTGAPTIPPHASLDDAVAGVVGHLADVILHWATRVVGSQTPEPVHQMRVAVRRLRSALTVFRRAIDPDSQAPWLGQLSGRLKTLAMHLGAARDWDVFLTETGADIGRSFAGDRRIAGLLAAATRRRTAAYATLQALTEGREWPDFELGLALLPATRPWRADLTAEQGELMANPVRIYAERALDRRLKHALTQGHQLSVPPPDQLHDLRKQIKKLRYATEFFGALFPEKSVRKYLSRLERLQAVLGAINDRAVAAGLLEQLAGGSDRAFASGVVLGFGAGRAARSQDGVAQAWAKFARTAPFWD